MTTILKTRLHHYSFNTNNPEEAVAYDEMCRTIERDGLEGRGRKFKVIPSERHDYRKSGTVEDVEIDCGCVFDNQWNETEASGNRRLFDWYEAAVYVNGREQRHIRYGHWLEITPEMVAVRMETRKCGYCGKHYGPHHTAAPGEFCTACLDSPYLKETELHLLRLLPLTGLQTREKLAEAEQTELLPLYVERQTTGKDSRAVAKRDKQRADVLRTFSDVTEAAQTERDGKLWLLDQGFDLDNVIFYKHTGKFGFGWRSPLSDSVVSKLLDFISEFPFPYTIECADGRKLQGD